MQLIDGVKVKHLRVIPDERGRLTEILRNDDMEFFTCFGQVYMTTAYPGAVKAWHFHKEQTDTFACIHGMMKIVLYDNRNGSSTKGAINEFFAGIHNPILIRIPPGVLHGFKCVSETEAIVVNIPNKVYDYKNPDEFRIPAHSPEIPYDWARKDG
ncbi:dTDP-4-dehydrorhamnose 3,5-epimerase family protein [Candidatus Sumerlaeota bacterium]|nr:dTDP-4-dehydrorhamnose 3,5-epimerase family protein [Candidatus Sumerlaeota bacterium]